jgi:hypothetical protein
LSASKWHVRRNKGAGFGVILTEKLVSGAINPLGNFRFSLMILSTVLLVWYGDKADRFVDQLPRKRHQGR